MSMSYKYRMIRAKDSAAVEPIDATHAVLCRNLRPSQLEGDYTEQSYADGTEGAQQEELFNPRSGVQFELDGGCGGAAGTAPRIGHLLKACGLSETIVAATSVTYAPLSHGGSFGSVDLQMNIGGQVQDLGEARGSLSFTANSGQRPFFNVNLMGRYNKPVTDIWSAPGFAGWVMGPTCEPTNMQAFTIGGTTLCVTQFSFSDGRTPRVDTYMNCPGVDIAMRRYTGRIQVRMPDLATKELVDECRTGITAPFIWEINADDPANGAMRIAGPKVQMKWAGEADINGELGANIDLVFQGDQGDDDLAIIYKPQG